MKHLPPTLREDQRYLKFKIHAESKKELGEVVDAVWSSALSLLGSKGVSKADPWIIGNRFNEEKQVGVIKVERSMEEDFRSALCLLEDIGGDRAFISVGEVSGTLESLSQ